MGRLAALLVAVGLLSGCSAGYGNVRRVQNGQQFALPDTYTTVHVRGLGHWKWVEGLKAGIYKEEAEDDQGIYYRGPKGCVILLANKLGEEYLQTGVLPSGPVRNQAQLNMWSGTEGGLWVPKSGVTKKPKIYYYMDNTGAPNGAGLAGDIIFQATQGDTAWGPEVDDSRILKAFDLLKN